MSSIDQAAASVPDRGAGDARITPLHDQVAALVMKGIARCPVTVTDGVRHQSMTPLVESITAFIQDREAAGGQNATAPVPER